jgi:hypothetical protein
MLCSNGCGPIIDKTEAMIARLPESHAARAELERLLGEARDADTWVNDMPDLPEALSELDRLSQTLKDIEKRHPDAVVPDIAPESTATPAPEEVTPPAEAGPAVEPGLFPDVQPPVGVETKSLRVGRHNLSLRGLHPDRTFTQQLPPGEMAALQGSPNIRGVGAADLPGLTPRALAQMLADGKITRRVFDGIMKAAEDRIAAAVAGGG